MMHTARNVARDGEIAVSLPATLQKYDKFYFCDVVARNVASCVRTLYN
jgi:hypothetical protein